MPLMTFRIGLVLSFSAKLSADVATIQTERVNPRLTRAFHSTAKGMVIPAITLTAAAQRSLTKRSGSSAFLHFAIGPMPSRNIAGVMRATNTVLKYGGPTESLPRFSASMIRGYMVPSSTDAAEAASKTLLDKSKDSRDRISNDVP